MKELTRQGGVQEIHHGNYRVKLTRGYITGTVDMTRSGYGFITTDDLDDDVFVSAKNLENCSARRQGEGLALCKEKRRSARGRSCRDHWKMETSFVGTVEIMPNFAFLIPDNKNCPSTCLFHPQSLTVQNRVRRLSPEWLTGIRNQKILWLRSLMFLLSGLCTRQRCMRSLLNLSCLTVYRRGLNPMPRKFPVR